ncbi:hypothetical protein [Staphylothermus hellenicus]|uniref:CARDB domain-containing protein n=1 Tax=Staphylothermus hellenicus (strain DSM 12710 / JCM 10830 / BK20S6-10-b1 / P8) TaxID=591019 RepID=D7D8H7_STAHD|nr:hypothetical protein [Staphylothermus hellenicus]ADI32073.1 hypothetical protein Shell_0967 [Staphylothermus hellenicus DSM 12710]
MIHSTTREKPANTNVYISKYPDIVIGGPGTTATLTVTVKNDEQQGSRNVYVEIPETNPSATSDTKEIASGQSDDLSLQNVQLPENPGIYTWHIKLYDSDSGSELDSVDFIIEFNPIVTEEFASGETVSILIHTASGGQYPATVTLP